VARQPQPPGRPLGRGDGTLDHLETPIASGANSEPALGTDGAGTTVLAYVHTEGTPGIRALVIHR